MPLLSEAQIRAMMPLAGGRLDAHLPYINPALAEGRIDTPKRIAAFMTQLAHESGEYRYMEEIADGRAYETRIDLGNTPDYDGDGPRYKGHGPIQITGQDAHRRCGQALGLDLIKDPLLITLPQHATRSAVWFWNDKVGGLSVLADHDWIITISRFVNGGYNGLQDRLKYWKRNREIMGLPPIEKPLDWEEASIRYFQAQHGLFADGKVGEKTLAALRRGSAGSTEKTLKRGDSGDFVKAMQAALGVTPDGKFGPKTEEAVRLFQADRGMAGNGVANADTLRALGLSA